LLTNPNKELAFFQDRIVAEALLPCCRLATHYFIFISYAEKSHLKFITKNSFYSCGNVFITLPEQLEFRQD
jgi:hypothetical protein